MNRTLKLLMFSDVFIAGGFGLIDPILAIFIKDHLQGGTIFAAGFASMLFLVVKSAVQVPFSKYVDRHNDKVRWLITGTFLIALVPFLYIFATNVLVIYLAQILHGLGAGLSYPTWLGLWSVNLDRQRESFEWSVYSTATSMAAALTAAIGAALAEIVGFTATFIFVGLLTLSACGTLFFLEQCAEKQRRRIPFALLRRRNVPAKKDEKECY